MTFNDFHLVAIALQLTATDFRIAF